jgi:hypothetical protein
VDSRVKLTELNPELEGTVESGVLKHDCPVCRIHKVVTPISSAPFHEVSYEPQRFWKNGTESKKKIWQATGSFPDTLTLSPSINIVEVNLENGEVIKTVCWHGHIQNGEVS